jgi:hypothetical protein
MNSKLDTSIFSFMLSSSLLAILPFLCLSAFTIPSADDIFYHNYGLNKSLLEFLIHHYNTWTGRYFSNLLMAINPYSLTSQLSYYPLMTYGVQILFFLASFLFLKVLIISLSLNLVDPLVTTKTAKVEKIKLRTLTRLIYLLWIALFFHKMPRPTDSLYWFAGSSSHLVAMSFCLFASGLYLSSFKQNYLVQMFYYFLISLLTICICGSNETLMLQWIFLIFFAFIYERVVLNRLNLKLIFPFLISIICFAIVFLAPGNKIRAENLQGGHDLLLLVFKPLGLIVETCVRYLSVNLVILLFWSLPFLSRIFILIPAFLKEKRSIYLFVSLWFGFFFLTFVPSVWTMGGLPPRRVLNNTYLIILFLSFFILLLKINSWTFLFRFKHSWDKYFPMKLQKIAFLVSFLLLFNHYEAWKDLIHIPRFLSSLNERNELVLQSKGQDLVLKPFSYFPTTFFYEDITTDPTNYRNVVFAEFYKLKSVKLSTQESPN